MKIGLIRLDKIGDLVCTLPVDEVPWLEGHRIRWVISQGMGFIAANSVPGRRFTQLNKDTPWASFRVLRQYLREEKFDFIVSFQAPWWVSLAAWLEKVPVRAGVLSQWHSFLFLNRALRQKRSRAEKHEADYNLDLLAYALNKNPQSLPERPSARVVEGDKANALFTRVPHMRLRAPTLPDVQERLTLAHRSYVVVHPGMAGSALNWPQKNYVALIRELSNHHTVAITGTPADEPWLGDIRAGLQGVNNVLWLVGQVTPVELLGVLEQSRLVIAPSTGVAHLAAALGKPVLCFFSPVRVQRAQRWAPRGEKIVCLSPECFFEKADGALTSMEKITLDQVLEEARRLLP
ncbi:MAG: glycosyltransferase family 9 protein [Bdellovibrionaceae bacterium]|nr:glycosyltransferase family 9 protein [Pseudobdellovibrionaceae bacterium]